MLDLTLLQLVGTCQYVIGGCYILFLEDDVPASCKRVIGILLIFFFLMNKIFIEKRTQKIKQM